ncbi:MAG: hypothetical protein H6734_18105 [Alphaproteobacteria bacterium]|nr:hypothetical protein [Alphaproteobacteria bacterium]
MMLDDATLQWAHAGLADPDAPVVRDSNGRDAHAADIHRRLGDERI